MRIQNVEFLTSAPNLRSCPPADLPEFAFIGRSNVGKSSLINLLTGKKDLAKASGTPGKTKLLNFFTINQDCRFVDLPGYGYAKVGGAERADFSKAVNDYIAERDNLYCVFVLLDSRLPAQRIDLEFLSWLSDQDVPAALIFTKADKQSAAQTRANVESIKKALLDDWPDLPPSFVASTVTKEGRAEILKFVDESLQQS